MASPNSYKPRLILNIGVIGHRPNRLASRATEGIQASIGEVLQSTKRKLENLATTHKQILADDPPKIRVLSALAEGADRIGADAALAAGAELHALLPFTPTEYERDFAEDDSKEEFRTLLDQATGVLELPGEQDKADHAYEAVGYELLRRSDLLIAVWDSGPSAGRGGTTSIIERAIAIDVPVIHVDANGQHQPKILCRSDKILPYAEPGFEAVAHRELFALPDIIEGVLAPPARESDRTALRKFLDEPEHRWSLRCAYPILLCATGIRWMRKSDLRTTPYVESTRGDASGLLAWISTSAPSSAVENWLSAFAYADRLAVHFAQTFRSGYVANFILATIAVYLALFGIVFPDAKTPLVAFELVAIILIGWNTIAGSYSNWHRRWLDYRQLAERMRLIPITASLGTLTLPTVSRIAPDDDRSPTWVAWYARRVEREFPVPNVKFDDVWIGTLKGELMALLKRQISYHSKNSESLERLDHRLHILGLCLFGATALICIAFLITKCIAADLVTTDVGKLVAVMTAMAPALGAAILAIRVQGDFEGFAQRSNITVGELGGILSDIESDPQSIEFLRYHATRASLAISADLADWRHTFEGRPLKLPA